jgi:signal transduction histidine kinase
VGPQPGIGGEYTTGTNPYAVEGPVPGVLFGIGFALTAASLVAAFVGTAVRFRRSIGVERQQLKWFALSTGVLVLVLSLAGVLWNVTPVMSLLAAVSLTAWAVTIGIAVLRYRLYDVDLVISRTFTYVLLTVVLAVVYAGAVVVLGAVVGRDKAWVTAGATLLAAASFKLLHRRVQERVDRRFRPERHRALSVVAAFTKRLRHDQAEPEGVVDALRDAMGDQELELRFVLQPGEPPVDTRGRPATGPDAPGRESYPVLRGGTVLGEVIWSPSEEKRALLASVIAAAVLPIEMARLRVELRRRLDEVAESRSRLAAVADQERRRIERDLHDGAQQRLVSIGLALRHAQHQLGADAGEANATLDDAVVEISAAIEDLRELAHGLRPALLQAGLGPALRDLASRSPVPVEVSCDHRPLCAGRRGGGLLRSLRGPDQRGQARAGRSGRPANRPSELHSRSQRGRRRRGGAAVGRGSGLTGLSDRVAARGGRLRIESARGHGTTLIAELPCVS